MSCDCLPTTFLSFLEQARNTLQHGASLHETDEDVRKRVQIETPGGDEEAQRRHPKRRKIDSTDGPTDSNPPADNEQKQGNATTDQEGEKKDSQCPPDEKPSKREAAD